MRRKCDMLKAFDAGLAKIMSKMGISVVDSYRGAYQFDILGLNREVVDRCFPLTPAPLGGVGFAEIERNVRATLERRRNSPQTPAEAGPAGLRLGQVPPGRCDGAPRLGTHDGQGPAKRRRQRAQRAPSHRSPPTPFACTPRRPPQRSRRTCATCWRFAPLVLRSRSKA